METVAVTAIVTAHKRVAQTLTTLQTILQCRPAPSEVLVHIDGENVELFESIQSFFPAVRLLVTSLPIGPGGGRNKLIAEASNEYVASFDDDSFPVDSDYFAKTVKLFEQFPEASIICAVLFHQGEEIEPADQIATWKADFCGGAAIYRRSAFLQTGGYVPIPIAYGMEESDLALRLHARGGRILQTKWLRVFHDTDLKHHNDPVVTAGSIANLALLTYLRYPRTMWMVGVIQCLNRIAWLMKNRRWQGIWSGIVMIPAHLKAHRCYRNRLSNENVKSYLFLRRTSMPATF